MDKENNRSISEMIDDDELMTEAIRRGVEEEMLSNARAGISVPSYENGQIVWITPEEIFRRHGFTPPPGAKAS